MTTDWDAGAGEAAGAGRCKSEVAGLVIAMIVLPPRNAAPSASVFGRRLEEATSDTIGQPTFVPAMSTPWR
ncbi:hypothetical protein [Chelatococcus asaccharovorans]|uniref:hypothetical protein n=1 Tax=Chelatococcus asaccharovorans TaxID=28210 RepID=UPI00224C6436|nr:hypothetical protein [Chelatococcus asaccharovorans]CAH1659588.1 hypothetical protein CHELA40_11754 [Chelatococcus asaccharovorans]CAH1684133.1 hypothetical protein CHELA17_63847 [Chelatococcus asaccharovorans]